MNFSLEIVQAQTGDCLLVHYGTHQDPGLVLIDGGPDQVYESSLKPRLMEIKKDAVSLPLDLVMISHIDDDHINGILQLTKELSTQKSEKKPLSFKIRSLWHNTFDRILGNTPEKLLAAVTASFGAASLSGEPDTEGLEPEVAKVLASVDQGLRLGDDARKLNLVNREFKDGLIMAGDDGGSIDMARGLKLTVVGPMRPEILKLQKEYDSFLEKHPEKRETPAVLAAFTKDTSPANLSSIVVLAEAGGKKLLLTGDARGDKILAGLELVGLLKKGEKLHVDILKAPHHGSSRNLDATFFRRLTADHYVFSANGEYGNPERETLQMLLDERGDQDYTVHLTYPLVDIDVEREKNWNNEQGKEKKRQEKNPNLQVRENWSPEEHGLKAFFKAHPDFAKKLSISEEGKPHIIDLLDEVGF
jgi:beta-lactamase superfamily II metal-dependent hydrolase